MPGNTLTGMQKILAFLPKRILANSSWLLLARISTQVLAIVFTILVARKLGETGLGQYSFIATMLFIGNVVTSFGMDTLLIRELARAPQDPAEFVPAALWLQLGLSALFIALVFITAGSLPGSTPETTAALKLYSFSLIPLAFTTVFSAILRAYERMDLYLLLSLVASGCQTVFALVILLPGGGLVALTWGLLIAQVLSALVSGWLCLRYIPALAFRWQARLAAIKAVAAQGAPLALLSGLAVIYQRLGILMLTLLTTYAVVGWFSAASRIVDGFKILNYAFFGAIFPVLARQTAAGSVLVGRVLDSGSRPAPAEIFPTPVQQPSSTLSPPFYRLSALLLGAYSGIIAVGMTFFAQPFVRLLYGPNYEPTVQALQILIWSLVPYAYTSKVSVDLVTSSRERLVLFAVIASLVFATILSLFIIPAYGLNGACWAVVAGEGFQALVLGLLAHSSAKRSL